MRGHIASLVDITLKGQIVAVIQRNETNGLYVWHTMKGFRALKPEKMVRERWRSRYYEDSETVFQNCFEWLSRHMKINAADLHAVRHMNSGRHSNVRKSTRGVNPEVQKAARSQIEKVRDILLLGPLPSEKTKSPHTKTTQAG